MRTTTTGMERSLWGALCAEGYELAEEADRRYSTRVPSDTHWTLWDQFVSGFCDQAQRLLSNGFTPYISITQSRILVRFTRKFKHPTPVEFTVEYVADDAAWRWALDSSLNPSGLFQMSDSVEETTEWAIAAVVDWEERIVHMRFPHNPTVPNGRAMAASAEFAAACESEGWTTFTPRVLACVEAWDALMVSDQRPDIEALIAAGFSAHVIPNRRKGKGPVFEATGRVAGAWARDIRVTATISDGRCVDAACYLRIWGDVTQSNEVSTRGEFHQVVHAALKA